MIIQNLSYSEGGSEIPRDLPRPLRLVRVMVPIHHEQKP